MDACMCLAESLRCSPETITMLISYTPTQDKKFFKNPKEKKGWLGHKHAQREYHVRTRGEDGHLHAKERGLRRNPANTLILDLQPLEL